MDLQSINQILAVNLDMKSTDYLLALAMAYFVIKECFKIISNKKHNGPIEITRVTDESEIQHRTHMMNQHEKIMEGLTDSIQILNGISAVTKSTNEKCGRMEKSIIIMEDRIVNQ